MTTHMGNLAFSFKKEKKGPSYIKLSAATVFQKKGLERGLTSQVWDLPKNSRIDHLRPLLTVEEGVRRPEGNKAGCHSLGQPPLLESG